MFLRGYGSQSYSQQNGWGYTTAKTSTTYKSGEVGKIQGDGMRLFGAHLGMNMIAESLEGYLNSTADKHSMLMFVGKGFMDNFNKSLYLKAFDTSGFGLFGPDAKHLSAPEIVEGIASNQSYSHRKMEGSWAQFFNSPCQEEFELFYNITAQDTLLDSSRMLPTADEIRPVNVAVRYYIKAK